MKNKVELIGTYGDDELIACSAWTSTSRELSEEKRKRIPNMLNDLWFNGHETPFEKGIVHFLVDTDIASHIHLLKHRISSANAESARYKELKEDKYYLPEDWEGIKASGLEGEYLEKHNGKEWLDILEAHSKISNQLYHRAVEDLSISLGRKRAKESARFFKGYNSQIQADISFNMRSFANFQNLRNSDSAQVEIRDIAKQMLDLVKETGKFNHTIDAWDYKKYNYIIALQKKQSLASKLFDSDAALSDAEIALSNLITIHEPLIEDFDFTTDYYDCSIEIYVKPYLPYPYEPGKKIREEISKLGFDTVYWNFIPAEGENYPVDEIRGYEPRHYKKLGEGQTWIPNKYGYVDERFIEDEWVKNYNFKVSNGI